MEYAMSFYFKENYLKLQIDKKTELIVTLLIRVVTEIHDSFLMGITLHFSSE